MFDVQHGRAPEYMTDLCVPCQDSRLWSAARGNFSPAKKHLQRGSLAAMARWDIRN